MDVKIGDVLFHFERQLFFGKVGCIKPGIVGPAYHPIRIFNAVKEGIRDIADMNIIALEIFLKDHDVSVGRRGINKMVDQEIETHARRHTKNGSEAQCYRIRTFQQLLLSLSLRLAVERYRLQRGVLRAENIAGFRAIAAVGRWINHELGGTSYSIE